MQYCKNLFSDFPAGVLGKGFGNFLVGLLMITAGCLPEQSKGQVNYTFPGMQAQTSPIPVVNGNNYPKANDTAITSNLVYINDFNNHTNLFDSAFIKNIITFRINEAIPRTLAKKFNATLTYKVFFTGKSGLVYDSVRSNLTLAISFDTAKAAVYNTSNSLVFYNGYKVKVKILSVTLTDTSLLKALEVDNTIVYHNYYKFDCTNSSVTDLANTGPLAGVGIPDELPVTWSSKAGVSGYDLEWTYIDSSAITSNKYGVQNTPAFYQAAFLNNATRVNLTDTFTRYNIPLLFEKQGILYARIRSFQNVPNGRRMESNWNSYTYYGFNGHQTNLNWQSSTSFAEEGKRKSIVQYYDGSLRNRQTVTKDNTTRTTIVAEKFYDNQGRDAIQVLPAPTLNTIIQYTANFNSINTLEYDKTHFDRNIIGYVCGSGADSMSNNAGASQYYSPLNPSKNVGFNQFIPDAKDYPFSEVKYLPDNTGRISMQGGVGKMHQIGNGHETRYYYGNPDQTELDGLFGSEVGIASHYFKNMVRDANGQYSVSYIDMHGRTIATALAGNLDSTKLDYLSNKKDSLLTKTITDSTNNITKGLYSESSKTILITKLDTVYFNYTLPASTLIINDCNNQPVSYNCLFDLLVTITDHCNNQTFGGQPYTYSQTNIPSASSLAFNVKLPEGEYVVTKTLTINQASLEYYRDSVFMKRNLCSTITSITQTYIDSFKTSHNNCTIPTCTSCLATLGTYTVFRTNLITQNGWNPASISAAMEAAMTAEYNKQTANCKSLCAVDINQIDLITSQMLADVSPGGQYADTTHVDQWSIFFISGSIYLYQSALNHYTDENGKLDTVFINGTAYTPNQLGKVDFINNFKPSWANALLGMHPEFARLQYLNTNVTRSSFDWNTDFNNTPTFQAAYSKGYLNPTGNAAFVNKFTSISLPYVSNPSIKDSFFILNPSMLTSMNNKMNLYSILTGVDTVSIWGSASAMGYCNSGTNQTCVTTNKKFPFADTSGCVGNANSAWQYFTGFYGAAKISLIQTLVTTNSPVSTQLNTAFTSGTHTSRFNFDPTTALNNANPGVSTGNVSVSGINANQVVVNSLLKAQYPATCSAYASVWWSQLAPCTTIKLLPDSANIINNLINVCTKGSDANHPYGSSSISTDSSYTFASFDSVINFYIAKYNSSHSDSIKKQSCNGELILYPKPFLASQLATDKPIYGLPDTATCNRVSNLYKGYQLSNGTYSSFSNYLSIMYSTTITDSVLNILLSRCALVPGICTNLSSPIVLPPALQGGIANYCIACDRIITLNNQFSISYPGKTPTSTYNSSDTIQTAINSLYENFMNNQTGFSRHTSDYLTFLSQCSGYSTNSSDTCNQFNFQKDIGGSGSDVFNAIKPTLDGGYIIAGASSSYGHGGQDGYLVKTDKRGVIQWSRTYGGTSDDLFKNVIQTPDSGFLAVGTTSSYHTSSGEVFLVRTNAKGDVLWSKGFNNPNTGYYGDNGFDVAYTSADSGFVVSGADNLYSIEIIKLSKTGVVTWAESLQPWENPTYPGGILMDGDTIVCAGFFFGGEAPEFLNRSTIFKINRSNGSIYWKKNYTVDSTVIFGNYAQAISKTSNGYILDLSVRYLGVESYSNVILNVDKNGNTRWAKRLPTYNGFFALPGLQYSITGFTTSDGGYLAINQSATYPDNEIVFTKLDSAGNLKWDNKILRTGMQQIFGVAPNADGSFMAVGKDQSAALLLKADTIGKTHCNDSSFLWTLNNLSSGSAPFAFYDSSSLTYPAPDITVTALTVVPNIVMVCSQNKCSNSSYLTGPTLCNSSSSVFMPVMPVSLPSTACSDSTVWAASRATTSYQIYSDSLKGNFWSSYIGKCLQVTRQESLTMSQKISEYQYMLYYYDQAGNLVKTVPPAGVVRNYNSTWLTQVKQARTNGTLLAPPHFLVTQYRYNTINLTISQRTPDAGTTNFWYDRLGRLALSQNAKQFYEGTNYSYTLYDPLGRITEVGQINTGIGAVSTNTTKIPSQLTTWLANNSTNRYQITNTVYDLPAPAIISPWLIQNTSTLRNRVSYTTITPGQKGSAPVYATYYNYDIAGNVSTLLQDYGATSPMGAASQEYKRVDYNYDLISGKVNSVAYQSGKPDAFMHFYQYDAENRLTDVYSSADSVTVEHEAHYSYYLHGPLARSLIGANQVQGMDYAYTLQGWLKSVNGTTLNPLNDMGQDGNTAVQSQQYIGRDAYGYSLQYFEGDYYPIVGGLFLTGAKAALGTTNYKGLYNGNISSMAVNIGVLNDPKLYNYKYDQLNRITGMDVFNGTNTGLNLWSTTLTATNDYQERAAYDPNGNLTQYLRNGYGSTQIMDSITYRYNFDAQGRLMNNRLDHIRDRTNNVDNSPNYPNDPDDQAVGNYKYDSAGNLIYDGQKGISPIVWSVYGKMLSVVKGSTTINYQYDAAGNRIGKNVGTANNWYVRDAQGNILAAYGGTGMVVQEQHLYGSSRLGMISNPVAIAGTAQYLDNLGGGTIYTFTRGNKLFELTNHLGNVWVTVSDKKYGTPVSGVPSQVSYYTADVKSAQDYYPFGMEMPGRQYNYNYAYSFNDKRDDKDANYGWQDYGMREYDRRLGRFFSVDPLINKYPELTPYQFASNQPIWATDWDGEEAKITITTEVTGYTIQRLTGKVPRGTMVVVPTYKAVLTDAQIPNKIVATGNVTRDSWYSRGKNDAGEYELINRHFEPSDAKKNLFTGERYNYPLGTDLKAYKLSQNSNTTLNAQPHSPKQETFLNGTPIDEARINYAQASNIYFHIGGFYQHTPGPDKTLAASYGCFGFVSSPQIYATIQEANEAIEKGSWNFKGTTNEQYLNFIYKIQQVKIKYKGTDNDKVLIQVTKRENAKEEEKKSF